MTDLAYEIKNLVKRYSPDAPPANDGITLNIKRGEVFGLLGPNGAGKSTLVRQLAGLSKPTSGTIRLFGMDLTNDPDLANEWVAMQPQNVWLPAQTKPQEVLETTGRLRGLSPLAAKKEAEQLLEEFKLTKHLHKKMQILSGGLRRLVSIAVTLIANRPIIILDEPTNDLDPEIRRAVWNKIRETASSGSTIILVTHNVVEAEQTLDRVGIIRNGRILAEGTVAELKASVARQVRLELALRSDADHTLIHSLEPKPLVHQLSQLNYSLILDQREVENTISQILPHLHQLEDFRIVTSNLEDIYFQLSGGDRIERELDSASH